MKKRATLDQVINHNNWLKKHGVHPDQIKKVAKPKWEYDLEISETTKRYRYDGSIPGNGTQHPTIGLDKAKISSNNFTIAPAYNKGPVMVIAKEDIKTACRKI
jgi:hypothetical protein